MRNIKIRSLYLEACKKRPKLPFFLFLAFLAIVYIGNQYHAEKLINEVSQLIRDKMNKYERKEEFKGEEKNKIIIDYNENKITLKSKNSKYPNISFKNNKSITIGRSSENTFRINNAFVSSKHLKIKFINVKLYVKDLNSSNGTYIDGKKLTVNKYYSLAKNQKLILGSEDVIYTIGEK